MYNKIRPIRLSDKTFEDLQLAKTEGESWDLLFNKLLAYYEKRDNNL